MAAVLMSNPGLHLAVLGKPPTRRNKRKKASAKKRRAKVAHRTKRRSATMAKTRRNKVRRNKSTRRNRSRTRRNYRRNPSLAASGKQYIGGLTSAPSKVMNLFKGKGAMKNVLFTGGGLVGTYVIANMVRARTEGMLMSIPGMGNDTVRRVVYGLMPYTMGFVGSMFIKNAKYKAALKLGGALGSIIEIIAPGMLANQIAKIPVVGQYAGQMGLYGYISAPSYAGSGSYVDAPSYAGSGAYVDAPSYAGAGEDVMLAGYVDQPAYAGSGEEMLAGNFIEDASIFAPAF